VFVLMHSKSHYVKFSFRVSVVDLSGKDLHRNGMGRNVKIYCNTTSTTFKHNLVMENQ